MSVYKKRRISALILTFIFSFGFLIFGDQGAWQKNETQKNSTEIQKVDKKGENLATGKVAAENNFDEKNELLSPAMALMAIDSLDVKGRAPKTGYSRGQFGMGWNILSDGCNVREAVLRRDLEDVVLTGGCRVARGKLNDPYTGKNIDFVRGERTSAAVQIDHVVALSNSWQTGAQNISAQDRNRFANDPLNLLAVDGPANQQKGDADAATWLPKNSAYRCSYVARQVSIKKKYHLWLTEGEKRAMIDVLKKC